MKDFKKSDLENGYMVQLRCGDRGIIVGDYILCTSPMPIFLKDYNDDLTMSKPKVHPKWKDEDFSRFSIDSVFDKALCLDVDNINKIPIWKREPVKEVTIEDIEKKFGCKVKIVGDK